MIGFKKRDGKDLLKEVARQKGVSVVEIRLGMMDCIEYARNNPDPQKRAEFQKYFGNRTPTPEEFIYTITKKLKK